MDQNLKEETLQSILKQNNQIKEAALFRISQVEHFLSSQSQPDNDNLQKSVNHVLNSVNLANENCSYEKETILTQTEKYLLDILPYFTIELTDASTTFSTLLAPNTFQVEINRLQLPVTICISTDPPYPIIFSSLIPNGITINENQIQITQNIEEDIFFLIATVIKNETAISATINFILC